MPKKLPRFLTPQEISAMFRVASGSKRDYIVMKSLFYLGLRNSELLNLRVDDVDLINRLVKVVQGKGKKDRIVPVPSEAFSLELKEWIGSREEGLLFAGRNEDGRLSDRHLRRIVKAHAKAAGIRKASEIHPHTLRHSYATFLYNSGSQLNEIQALLGHKNIETTTIYTHLGIENLRKTAEKAFKGL
jgi:site-specific recombinase XerD